MYTYSCMSNVKQTSSDASKSLKNERINRVNNNLNSGNKSFIFIKNIITHEGRERAERGQRRAEVEKNNNGTTAMNNHSDGVRVKNRI